jgi:hypothetical protein
MSPLTVFGVFVGVLGCCVAILWIVQSWSPARARQREATQWRARGAVIRARVKPSPDDWNDQDLSKVLHETHGNLADLPSEWLGKLTGIYPSPSSPQTTRHEITIQRLRRYIARPIKKVDNYLIAKSMGHRSGAPTNQLTVRWLMGLLPATDTRPDHGANLDVIKSIRDAETTELAATFNTIAGAVASVTVPVVAFLYVKLTSSHETKSVSQTLAGVTTTTKFYSEPHFSTVEGAVLGVLLVFLVWAVAALYINRRRKHRVDRTFANAVTVYFFLSTHRT